MRDDTRPQDSFSWVRPWVPYGDDPFVWFDPSEDMKPLAAPAGEARPAPTTNAPARSQPVALAAEGDDIWVELPEAEEKPRRSRRSRGRGRDRAETPVEAVEAVAPVVIEPDAEPEALVEAVAAEPETPPAKPKRSRSKKVAVEPVLEAEAEAVAQVAALPEVVAEPTPVSTPRESDPAEIAGPAPAPRKGWWRRG